MKITLIPIVLGILLGILDTIPMIKRKINNYYIVSAFLFHLIMPTIVSNFPKNTSWWQVSLVYLLLTLPLAVIILREEKKDSVIMASSSIIVGIIVGLIL